MRAASRAASKQSPGDCGAGEHGGELRVPTGGVAEAGGLLGAVGDVEDDGAAERAQHVAALDGHRLRHREDAAVAAGGRGERQPQRGVS